MTRNTTPRRYPAKHDKSGTYGCARVRRPCIWHPNVAGCRYDHRGIRNRADRYVIASWTGTPGASHLHPNYAVND